MESTNIKMNLLRKELRIKKWCANRNQTDTEVTARHNKEKGHWSKP